MRRGPGRARLLPPGAGALLKISTDAACREVSTLDSADEADWAGRVLDARILSDPGRPRGGGGEGMSDDGEVAA